MAYQKDANKKVKIMKSQALGRTKVSTRNPNMFFAIEEY